MQVVILCGGFGTRLKEETEIKPKPMVEIGGKPILWHIMKSYAHYGFNKFVLALGYKGEYIKNFFYHYRITCNDFTITLNPTDAPKIHSVSNDNFWEITCVDTGEKTLKGGRIKRLAPYIDGHYFHLTYGDGVSDVNLRELADFHLHHGAIGTVTGVRPPSRFGEMSIEGDHVRHFEEKPQLGMGLINGGFFIFKKDFLDYLSPEENCDFEFGALQKLATDGQLRVYKHKGFWQCMDNVRERDYLNKLWDSNNAPWKPWR
jgi:glucose-1-phosphate cytidylyltransferase